MNMYLRKYTKQLITAGIALIGALLLFWFLMRSEAPVAEATPKPVDQTQAAESETAKSSKTIVVDIKGAVNKPGVYQVAKDARVQDLIHLAGGVNQTADMKQINLAAKLKDEESIYIAKIGEIAEQAATDKQSKDDTVNINTASLQELQGIPGVGPAKAQAILEYRESTGLFQKVEDLKHISGFGEKTIERLKNFITVK